MFKGMQSKCKCVNARKYVASVGYSEDDVSAVATLPDDWVPKHSGPTLANYLKQREADHEKILEDISKSTAAVNEDINATVRTLAENLLALIKQNQQDMDCVIQKCNTTEAALTKEARNIAFKEVSKLLSQRVDDMSAFKREALALERQRAERLKIVLRDDFQRLIAVGHKTPKDILHYFDQQTYEINQQLLGNSRAYTELEAQLRVQADESVLRARTSLNQLCLGAGMLARGRSATPWTKDEKSLQPRSASADRHRKVSVMSIGGILSDVEEFDAAVSHLVQAYRTAVLKVFNGFSNKLEELEKDLFSQQLFNVSDEMNMFDLNDIEHMIERALHRLSGSIDSKNQSKSLLEMTGADMITMKKSLLSLGECLHDTYTILHDAGHLWDAHILRSALVQKLTIVGVEDLQTSNDAVELANEIPFSVALEQMRCSSDANEVHREFNALMVMLDRTAGMYLEHSQAELGRLEEFMKLPTSMSNTLLAEFNVFLEKHPRTPLRPMSSRTSVPASPTTVNYFVHLPLPRAILQTELQEIALKNWRNGFLESFESNVSLVPEELRHQAQLLVEERGQAIQMRYSLKMVSHSIRIERLKAARDTRLAELNYHETRLNSHLRAVYDLLSHLTTEAAGFAAIDSPLLYPLCKWKARLETDMNAVLAQDPVNQEVTKLKMSSYISRLAKHRHLFEESLDVAILEYKKQMEYRVQEVRISNVRFLSQIKLFSEGGRYGSAEALRFCASLVRGSQDLETSIGRALTALTNRRTQLLALADTELVPLRQLLGIETGQKHGQAKSGKKNPAKRR